MKNTIFRAVMAKALIVVVLGSPIAAYSHHGANNNPDLYLAENLLRLEGEVTTVFWRNPHPRLILSVIDQQGEEQEWELEMGGSINSYQQAGIGEDLVAVGDRVKAAGVVSRRDPRTIGLQNMLLPNGEELVRSGDALWSEELVDTARRGPTAAQIRTAEASAEGLFRVWGRRTSGRPSASEYAGLLTNQGRELAAQYNFATDNPELECRSGIPTNMFDPTPMQLIDNGDHIVIYTEEHDLRRMVYMTDDRPEAISSNLGFSIGHWQGDSLIVETSHIEWPYFDPYGTPQSDQMTYQETFWVAADDSRLNYKIVATDPVYLTGSIELERAWLWQPGTAMVPFNCAAEVASN